jgi:hypothetical protein
MARITTIHCNCPQCIQNDLGHFYCFKLADLIDKENKDFCTEQGYYKLYQK